MKKKTKIYVKLYYVDEDWHPVGYVCSKLLIREIDDCLFALGKGQDLVIGEIVFTVERSYYELVENSVISNIFIRQNLTSEFDLNEMVRYLKNMGFVTKDEVEIYRT